MKAYELREADLLISDDPILLDHAMIHQFLSERSYWAQGISLEDVKRSLEHSLCFGIYLDGQQIGFARAVTDFTTFAWLSDVFIIEEKRGNGFSRKLIAFATAHPKLQNLRRFMLITKDAHGLYAQSGFKPISHPEIFMEICRSNFKTC